MAKRFLDLGGKSNNRHLFFGSGNAKNSTKIEKEIESYNPWDSVVVYGGEPTVRKDFFKILANLQEKGINKISLITNARAFSYSELAAKLKGIKGLHVYVELLAPTEEEHNKLTGTKSFRQSIEGLKNLRDKGIESFLIVPVIEQNKNQLYSMGEMANIYDVEKVVLANFLTQDFSEGLRNLPYYNPLVFSTWGFSPAQVPKGMDICTELEDLDSMDLKGLVKLRIIRALEKFQDKSLIYVSLDEVYYLLKQLLAKENFMDFAHYVGFPIPVLVRLFEELENEGILNITKDKVQLNVDIAESNRAKGFKSHRLEEDPSVCQLRVEEDALFRRADFIEKCCGGGGRLAILGDDDFFSLIIASKNIFAEIFVFELDERVCNKIENIAAEKKYNIRVYRQDLCNEFHPMFSNKFDAFYTDCPYSVNGFSLFFSRGIQLLRKERKKNGFVSFSPNLPIETVEMGVQRVINDSGVYTESKGLGAINEMPDGIKREYSDFRELKKLLDNYEKVEQKDSWFLSSLGREERLFHFLTTSISRPLITGQFDGEIYYGENPLAYYMDDQSIKETKSKMDIFKY